MTKLSAAIMAGVLSFAAGLAVGVMFAPASGERTRRRLRRRGEEIADKAAESVQDIVDRARRRIA
jgi:gas vesicle protein